jgi:anti-anti-sigma regulatory factor
MKYDIQPADPSILIIEFDGEINSQSAKVYEVELLNTLQAIDKSIKKVRLELSAVTSIDATGYDFFMKIQSVIVGKNLKFEILGASKEFNQVIKSRSSSPKAVNSRRKFQRVPIQDLFTLFIIFPIISESKVKILDISESGLRFHSNLANNFQIGDPIRAHLHINKRLYLLIELKIVRIESENTSGEFIRQTEKGIEALYSLINFLRTSNDDK